MKRRKNSHAKVLYLTLFMGSSICCTGCSTKEPPPSEVIEIETIEILDLNKKDGALEPSTAEKEVDKARSAKQSADEAKAAADREIEAAGKSVSSSDKPPTGSEEQPASAVEPEAAEKNAPKEPPSDASN